MMRHWLNIITGPLPRTRIARRSRTGPATMPRLLLANGRPWRRKPWQPPRFTRRFWLRCGALALAAGVAAVAALGLRVVYRSTMFEMRTIEIRGLARLDENEVRRWSRIPPGGALERLDLVTLKARLLAHPWIKDVMLRKVYPDRLVLQVVERVPAAVIADRGVAAVVDPAGAVLHEGPAASNALAAWRSLPIVRGVGLDALRRREPQALADFRFALAVVSAVAEGGGSPAALSTEASPTSALAVQVGLDEGVVVQDGGYRVRLGRERFAERWGRYRAVAADIVARTGGRGVVDLRFPEQVIVR